MDLRTARWYWGWTFDILALRPDSVEGLIKGNHYFNNGSGQNQWATWRYMTADPCKDNYATIILIVYSVPYCTSLLYSFIMKHNKDQQTFCDLGPRPNTLRHIWARLAASSARRAAGDRRVQIPKIGWWFQCHLNVISAEFLRNVTLTLDEPTPEVVSETSLHLEHLSNWILRFQYLMWMQTEFLPTISNSIQYRSCEQIDPCSRCDWLIFQYPRCQ